MIGAYLLHLSYNMWGDRVVPGALRPFATLDHHLQCDADVWDELVDRIADAGLNMVVVDLGDGVLYESRPEIAVQGAWPRDRLREALARMRSLGLEPIPKLNFSTGHDAWLGPYARMVSTPAYYAVCADLIAECMDLFDSPRLFHLGMDEEDLANQSQYDYVVIRQHDLWWRDLGFLVEQVERRGARAWVWADALWAKGGEYLERMPGSVLQSNWYYGSAMEPGDARVGAYLQLDRAGFDQVPTGSNWDNPDNLERTVRFALRRLAPERFLGFLQTAWAPALPQTKERHIEAIDRAAAAVRLTGRAGS